MRSMFPEYFAPEKAALDTLWKRAVCVFDTNVILNLYRYTPKTYEEILTIFAHLKKENRLWVPYQVGHEFMKNRIPVIKEQKARYKKLSDDLKRKEDEIIQLLEQHKRHPYLNAEALVKQHKATFAETAGHIQQLESSHPDYVKEDPILLEVIRLFDACVGADYDEPTLQKRLGEAKARYDKHIPPGYMDKKEKEKEKENDPARSLYGDVLVWFQTMEYAKANKQDIIFVTDDLKEDWWRTDGSGMARAELFKEFAQETGQQVLIYKPDIFLKHAPAQLSFPIETATVQEVVDVQEDNRSKIINKAGDAWFNDLLKKYIYGKFSEETNFPADFVYQDGTAFIKKLFPEITGPMDISKFQPVPTFFNSYADDTKIDPAEPTPPPGL